MRALRTAVVLVLTLALPAPVLAADFQAALEAYERGDYATALKEFRPLAEQGEAEAQHKLGGMYASGRGVPQDYAEAGKWYRRAAEQGQQGDQFMLGSMYYAGRGVPQDYVQAHMWYNLAAAGQPGRTRNVAVGSRDEIVKLMTPADVAKAERLAREWKPK